MILREELKRNYAYLENNREEVTGPVKLTDAFVFKPGFTSRHARYLLEIDREIQSNTSFYYVLFLPRISGYDRCLMIGHGLNEATYTKLFPWGYCLCNALSIPVIFFPLTFHINRRPAKWQVLLRSAYRERRQVRHNRGHSPFNAVISQRLSQEPERFFRDSLQSYHDHLDLLSDIQNGLLTLQWGQKEIRPFKEKTSIDFIGYSITGYLHLALLLIHGQGLLHESRCILFNTCAIAEDIDPTSVLVIDQEAFLKCREFYRTGYKNRASIRFIKWYEETAEGYWFRRLLVDSEGKTLCEKIGPIADRLMIMADTKDPIFPFESILKNFGNDVPVMALDLGRHEFPFNIESLKNKRFGDIASEIKKSDAPSPKYLDVFQEWLEQITQWIKNLKEKTRGSNLHS